MMSINCLRLHYGLPHCRLACTGNAACYITRQASNELLSSKMFIEQRVWGEKPIHFSFLLQLDYNNSQSSHLSFEFSPHVISTQLASCLNRMAL